MLALHLQGLERECLLKTCASVERHLPHPSPALFKRTQGGSLRHEGLVCYGFLSARSLISVVSLLLCSTLAQLLPPTPVFVPRSQGIRGGSCSPDPRGPQQQALPLHREVRL